MARRNRSRGHSRAVKRSFQRKSRSFPVLSPSVRQENVEKKIKRL